MYDTAILDGDIFTPSIVVHCIIFWRNILSGKLERQYIFCFGGETAVRKDRRFDPAMGSTVAIVSWTSSAL